MDLIDAIINLNFARQSLTNNPINIQSNVVTLLLLSHLHSRELKIFPLQLIHISFA